MTINMTTQEYTDRIVKACRENIDNIKSHYGAKDRIESFVRDFAYALNDIDTLENLETGYNEAYQKLIPDLFGKQYIRERAFYQILHEVIDWTRFLKPLDVDTVLSWQEFQTVELTYRHDPTKKVRLSSKVKTWKRDKNRVEFSVKYGMYETVYVSNSNLDDFSVDTLPRNW